MLYFLRRIFYFGSIATSSIWFYIMFKYPAFNKLDVKIMVDHHPLVSMQAYPKSITDGGYATISWEGIAKPTVFDFIAVTCGKTTSPDDIYRQEDVFRTTVDGKKVERPVTSSGEKLFTGLYMMRCNYTFKYVNFDYSSNSYRIRKEITVPMRSSFNAPKHGHISFTDNLDQMMVMFNSASNRTPEVRFGTASGVLASKATGTSTTYKVEDMCEAPANITSQKYFRDPGYMHRVVLKSLSLGTRYYYKYGNQVDGWSREYSFRSRPPSSVKSKFLAYGDMGPFEPNATATALSAYQQVMNGYDHFLLHFGDISYARGKAAAWDQYFHLIEPYAARVPYMVSIGNHEYDHLSGGERDPSKAPGQGFRPAWGNYKNDSGGECGVPTYHRFSAPKNGNSVFWYSFNYGGIHVLQLSTEHDFTQGSVQYQWIENDLKSVDRQITPWIIVTGHRMMYTTEVEWPKDITVAEHFRKEVEDLLYEHRVNLMLVGHQHSYERSCPVYKGICQKDGKGTVHITAGAAGYRLDESPFSSDIGNWSVVHYNMFGFLRIDSTQSQMKIQYILNKNGNVGDEVILTPWLE